MLLFLIAELGYPPTEIPPPIAEIRASFISQRICGSITKDDSPIRTFRADNSTALMPLRGKRYSIKSEKAQSCQVILRSHDFDAGLFLLDAEEQRVARDNDGWVGSQSQLTFEIRPENPLSIVAVAVLGGVGEFELEVRLGQSIQPDAEETKAWGQDVRSRVASLRFQGIEQLANRNLRGAQSSFEEAVALAKSSLGKDSHEIANCLFHLGSIRNYKFEFQEAKTALQEAIEIQEKIFGEEDLQTCRSIEQLGISLWGLGEFEKATQFLKRARQGYLAFLRSDQTLIGFSNLVRCGEISFRLGDWALSEESFRRCFPFVSEFFGPASAEEPQVLKMIGAARQNLGDWAQAKALLEEALSMLTDRPISDGLLSSEIRRRLAMIAMMEGNLDHAERLLHLAVEEYGNPFGANDPFAGQALLELADVFFRKGQLERAREVATKAINVLSTTPAEAISGTKLSCFRLLAMIALEVANASEARAWMEKIRLESGLQAGKQDAPGKLWMELAEGKAAFLAGDFNAARTHYVSALSLIEDGHYTLLFSRLAVLRLEVELDIDAGFIDRAWQKSQEAFLEVDGILKRLSWSLTEAERYKYVSSQKRCLDTLLSIGEKFNPSGADSVCFDAVTAWKGRVHTGLAATKRELFSNQDRSTNDSLEKLRAIQSQLSRLIGSDPKDEKSVKREFDRLQEQRSELESVIARRLGEVPQGRSVSWRDIQKALPADSTFVSFVECREYLSPVRADNRVLNPSGWAEPSIFAFVLTKSGPGPVRIDLGPSKVLSGLITGFLTELISKKPNSRLALTDRLENLNRQILERIWMPLAKHVQGGLILLSQEGVTAQLPFGVIKKANGKYLIEEFSFANVQEISEVIENVTQAASIVGNDLLVLGGVDFDTTEQQLADQSTGGYVVSDNRTKWNPLPLTLEEAESIISFHRSSNPESARILLKGSDASVSKLKSEMPRFEFLHLATHGFFRPDWLYSSWNQAEESSAIFELERDFAFRRFEGFREGLLSGIVCAGANGDHQLAGTSLTAEEVGWLDLTNCRLVVLSACQTGLGTARSGEGIIGLRSAFRQAGARTVVSSLWNVGDKSTKSLMNSFYEGLWKSKESALTSLRSAQLTMIQSQRKQYQGEDFPSLWGSFVLDGDWR